jgi:hypothetical protein
MGASGEAEGLAKRCDSNLDERFLGPFDVGMHQVDPTHRESQLLSVLRHFCSWNFTAERDGSVNAFNFDPRLPGPWIAPQRAPYSGRESEIGEGRRDGETDGRLHPFVSFLCVWLWLAWEMQSLGQKLLRAVLEIFMLSDQPENFFHGSSAQTLLSTLATAGTRQQ